MANDVEHLTHIGIRGRYNVYHFECPHCLIFGEVHVPIGSQRAFSHDCGASLLYIQHPAAGMFGKPRLEEVSVGRRGDA